MAYRIRELREKKKLTQEQLVSEENMSRKPQNTQTVYLLLRNSIS